MSGYPPPASPSPPPFSPAANPWNKPLRRCSHTVCFGLLCSLVLTYTVAPVLYTLARFALQKAGVYSEAALSLFDLAANLVVYLFVFLVPMFVMKSWIGIPTRIAFPMRLPRAGIAAPAVFACLGCVVVGSTLAGLVVTALQQVFGAEATIPDLPSPVGAAEWIVYILMIVVAPAVVEELLFRGVIMQSLRRFGDGFALVVSAILFAMAHGNLVQGPNALILGVAIGFFVLRSGSLLTGMLIHFVNNLLAVGLDLAVRQFPAQQEIIGAATLGAYTVAGVVALSFLAVTHIGIFRLAPSDYPVEPAQKYRLFFTSPVALLYIAGTAAAVLLTIRF